MKKIYAISLFIIFYSINCTAFSKSYFYINSDAGLILRTEPSLSSDKILTISKNEKIEIIDYSGPNQDIDNISANWFNIKYKDKTGWVFSGYLALKTDVCSNLKLWSGKWIKANKTKFSNFIELKINKNEYELFQYNDNGEKESNGPTFKYDSKECKYYFALAGLETTTTWNIEFINEEILRLTFIISKNNNKLKSISYDIYKKE